MRADFSKSVKNELAKRVAYKCSFPGCPHITIGPSDDNPNKSVSIGEAAHIYGASENGPRPNPNLTTIQRSSIDNGIWMCRNHAKLIDADTEQYSADTLIHWKAAAEKAASRALAGININELTILPTLIRIHDDIIFFGTWISAIDELWVFEIHHFVVGKMEDMINFSTDLDKYASWERFIIIESQGDGRELKNLSWSISEEKKYRITCGIKQKMHRRNPHSLGKDLALNDHFDLYILNGDFATVQGLDTAIQLVRVVLSTKYGDFLHNPLIGSLFSKYFWQFKHDPTLLNLLIKLETIRLFSVSTPGAWTDKDSPPLDFINRVEKVKILNSVPVNNQIPVEFFLEWGNYEKWHGVINISVRSNKDA